MSKRYTTDSFIEMLREKHSDRYDYSKTIYVASNKKLIVGCQEHGDFEVSANSHQQGGNCPTCEKQRTSLQKRLTQQEFVEKAAKIHGETLDLSKAYYIKSTTNVEVVCELHGSFDILPYNLLSGRGCSKCRQAQFKKGAEEFIAKSREQHGNIYNYDLVNFISNKDKVIVSCSIHGNFNTTPNNHIFGRGCKKCSFEVYGKSKISTTAVFIEKASKRHKDKYSYLRTEYLNAKYPIVITCGKHGDFLQSPTNHLSGQGCSKCGSTGYNKSKSGHFYVLTCGDITKVGITSCGVESRRKSISKSSQLDFEVYATQFYEDGSIPPEIEKQALRWLRSNYDTVTSYFEGYTECFVGVDLSQLPSLIAVK